MGTSGVYSFNMYRNEIIETAWRKVGVEKPTPEQVSYGDTALNLIVKDLAENEGIHLWKTEWKVKKFSAASEVLGTDGLNYTCIMSHTAAAINKPITGDEYAKHWIERGTSGVTWVSGTSYTSQGDFTPDADVVAIDRAFIRYSDADYPLALLDRYQFLDITSKGAQSFPTGLWLDRTGSAPVIRLDCQVTSTDYIVHYLQAVLLEDLRFGGDTADTPQRWLRPLVYLAASDLADEAPVGEFSIVKARELNRKAEWLVKRAKRGGLEKSSDGFVKSAY